MWEQSSFSGSSPSSPSVMARRRLVRRDPSPEMAEEVVREEKYELMVCGGWWLVVWRRASMRGGDELACLVETQFDAGDGVDGDNVG